MQQLWATRQLWDPKQETIAVAAHKLVAGLQRELINSCRLQDYHAGPSLGTVKRLTASSNPVPCGCNLLHRMGHLCQVRVDSGKLRVAGGVAPQTPRHTRADRDCSRSTAGNIMMIC